ncbi:methyltransferase domain-containing protein [Bryobacter aggregatus]|uniref:methyltransferase domain-containing protein n=1 Tax=Bryobacter aggregatus TaxID=360054 RepID=UPI00068975F4|nr:methyltransferase domain-containing protein [Bryobacter aggregatus]
MKASNPVVTAAVGELIKKLNRLGWYHSIELPDGSLIEGLQSIDQLKHRIAQFDLPERMDGLRVLDIGAWDGWFTFEMERRGATVTAIDLVENPRFLEARSLLGSKAEYLTMGVYDLDPAKIGRFDIVLFFGVLYHLKHPLLGLEKVCSVATGTVCVESFVSDDGSEPNRPPVMEFYEGTELCGQFDNWAGPNTSCLLAFCRTAGLVDVRLKSVLDQRAHIQCDRQWRLPIGPESAPKITAIENAISCDFRFESNEDPYASVWFKATQLVERNTIYAQFGPYASSAVSLTSAGEGGWHAVFKIPLGLDPGWIPVTLRVGNSAVSNTVTIGLDVSDLQRLGRAIPKTSGSPVIETLTDGFTWERNVIEVQTGAAFSMWVRDLPTGEVKVRINGTDVPSSFVSEPEDGVTQVNALLPSGIAEGTLTINVIGGEQMSPPVEAIAKRRPAYSA